ncbi:MAG: RDD family protein [Beutenbergiaceae bacterium]
MTGETGVPSAGHTRSLLLRRIIALCIDWVLASVISAGFFDYHPLATLAVFFGMRVILTATLGSSFGQRICDLGIRRLPGGTPSILQALARTGALCLIVPAGVTSRADGRGLHDVWAGTRLVRLSQRSRG